MIQTRKANQCGHASPDGAEGSLTIHQDARAYLSALNQGQHLSHPLPSNRHAWLQVLRGKATLNDHKLDTSDGAALSEQGSLEIEAASDTEIMLFDLP